LDNFQFWNSSTYLDYEHHLLPSQTFCSTSFYLSRYSLTPQPVIPCMELQVEGTIKIKKGILRPNLDVCILIYFIYCVLIYFICLRNNVFHSFVFASKWSYAHGEGTAGLIGATIGQLLEQRTSVDPDKEAVVVVHQNVRLTFQQLLQQVKLIEYC